MAKFELRYSPLFYDDLDKITYYILYDLKNQTAAIEFISNVELAIKKLLLHPLKTALYKSIKSREHPYRRIQVGNYLIFYVVMENTIIVRRLLYGPRDIDKIL